MIWEVIKTILCFGLNILMKKWKEVIQEEVKTALEPKLEELNLESSYKTFQLLTQEKEIDFFLIIKYELIESYYQDALKYIKLKQLPYTTKDKDDMAEFMSKLKSYRKNLTEHTLKHKPKRGN